MRPRPPAGSTPSSRSSAALVPYPAPSRAGATRIWPRWPARSSRWASPPNPPRSASPRPSSTHSPPLQPPASHPAQTKTARAALRRKMFHDPPTERNRVWQTDFSEFETAGGRDLAHLRGHRLRRQALPRRRDHPDRPQRGRTRVSRRGRRRGRRRSRPARLKGRPRRTRWT